MENDGRRKFLGVCLAGATVAAAAAAAYPVFRYLAPRSDALGAKKIEFAASDLPEGEAKFFEYAGASAVLVKTSAGAVIALSAVCTHLGCTVNLAGDGFHCPCHGSVFDKSGAVVSGPAPTGLAWFELTLSRDGRVVIDTAQRVKADKYLVV